MGITYLIISIDHPIALQIAANNSQLNYFIHKYNKIFTTKYKNDLTNYKKEGIPTDMYAIHPITQDKLPIWIANFTTFTESNEIGAIAACPAHNQQDWEFAHKYDLPIKPVIKCLNGKFPEIKTQAMTKTGILFNSGNFNGLTSNVASAMISKVLTQYGFAQSKIFYRLKDWGVSRQRYWGTPIPMIFLKDGTIRPVPFNQLPVILPENINIENDLHNALKKDSNWITTTYDNQIAFRDTDTFDTFIESSWYYARYTCPNYHDGMLDSNAANYWLPIDQYIGGIEHAIMHLMYFRFYHKLMRDAGLISSDEPATRLLCQGMILADSFYYISDNGQKIWVSPNKTIIKRDSYGKIIKAFDKKGHNLIYAGICKMSKSKNNGVNPNTIIQKYGADAVRFFIMFAAPVSSALEWKESGIEGAQRFLKRIWNITYQHLQKGPVHIPHTYELNYQQKLIRYNVHKTIIKVTDDIDRRQSFNTALSSIMKLVNKLYQFSQNSMQDRAVLQEALLIIVRLLYPFTPHISFILWEALGGEKNIDNSKWPIADIEAIQDEKTLIIIQVNGKPKKKIFVPINSDEQTVYEIAKKEFFPKYFDIKQINKTIYIPNKVINFLIK